MALDIILIGQSGCGKTLFSNLCNAFFLTDSENVILHATQERRGLHFSRFNIKRFNSRFSVLNLLDPPYGYDFDKYTHTFTPRYAINIFDNAREYEFNINELERLNRYYFDGLIKVDLHITRGPMVFNCNAIHIIDNTISRDDFMLAFNNIAEEIICFYLPWIDTNYRDIQTLYTDSDNVHNHTIQKCVKDSIKNICELEYDKEIINLDKIFSDNLISQKSKNILKKFCGDNSFHTELGVTYEKVLLGVWNRIEMNQHKDEIKTVLDLEIQDSDDRCFTGRISRLINCLCGFDDLVSISISDNDRIGTIITIVENELHKENRYTIDSHILESRKRLRAIGYDDQTIDSWVTHIM